MNEHDLVVLTRDLPDHGLAEDDVGTIVCTCTPTTPGRWPEFWAEQQGGANASRPAIARPRPATTVDPPGGATPPPPRPA